jgi:hypothetical protein
VAGRMGWLAIGQGGGLALLVVAAGLVLLGTVGVFALAVKRFEVAEAKLRVRLIGLEICWSRSEPAVRAESATDSHQIDSDELGDGQGHVNATALSASEEGRE